LATPPIERFHSHRPCWKKARMRWQKPTRIIG
jgi:hypothetical protein